MHFDWTSLCVQPYRNLWLMKELSEVEGVIAQWVLRCHAAPINERDSAEVSNIVRSQDFVFS